MNLSIGSSECHISISQIRKYGHVVVELYITDDKELYHKLYSNKETIENELGFELEWNELPERTASRILTYKDVDFDNVNDWNNQFEWIMDRATKMKNALKKYI